MAKVRFLRTRPLALADPGAETLNRIDTGNEERNGNIICELQHQKKQIEFRCNKDS